MRSDWMNMRAAWLLAALGACVMTGCGEEKPSPCVEGTRRSAQGVCLPVEEGTSGGDSGASADTASPDTGGAEQEVSEIEDPTLSVDEVRLAVETPFSAGFFGPEAVRALYLERMSHGDGRCPDSLVQLSDFFIFGCTTDEGWWFAGIATYEEFNGGEPWDGTGQEWGLSGDFEIIEPSGEVFRVGGEASQQQTEDDVWSGYVYGSWSQEGHAHPWVSGGISAMMTVKASEVSGSTHAVLHGGLGIGTAVLYMEELTWQEDGCWEHPTGTIMVRDPGLYWWTLDFSDDCSGCASLSYADRDEATEICPDLGSLRDQIIAEVVP